MKDLKLYYMETCPFCQRVLRFIEKSNIKCVDLVNVNEGDNQAKLIELGGKDQVPCLFIDGKPMYESMDIIRWLDANCEK